jgi:RimJ/RimL family protein N-acetyltransferase
VGPISLRPIRDDDDAFQRALFASTRVDELATLPPGIRQQFVDSQYDLQRRHYLAEFSRAEWSIIEHLRLPIGRLIVDDRPESLLLVDIALLSERRGYGVGTECIRSLMLRVIDTQRALILSVRSDNVAAQRLYTRLGFVGVGEAGGYIRMNFVQEKRVK